MTAKALLRGTIWLGIACFVTPIWAEGEKQTVVDKAVKSRGASDTKDPNIQSDSNINQENANIEPPPDKGGPKTRGGICQVHTDNRTRWIIAIYIDGRYRGTTGPFDDLFFKVYSGATRVYARAAFDDGSYRTWGPRVFNCEEGESYTWTLGY